MDFELRVVRLCNAVIKVASFSIHLLRLQLFSPDHKILHFSLVIIQHFFFGACGVLWFFAFTITVSIISLVFTLAYSQRCFKYISRVVINSLFLTKKWQILFSFKLNFLQSLRLLKSFLPLNIFLTRELRHFLSLE